MLCELENGRNKFSQNLKNLFDNSKISSRIKTQFSHLDKTQKIIYIYMYNNICIIIKFCPCVWPAIDSNPGGYTDMRPVLSHSVWPEGVQ